MKINLLILYMFRWGNGSSGRTASRKRAALVGLHKGCINMSINLKFFFFEEPVGIFKRWDYLNNWCAIYCSSEDDQASAENQVHPGSVQGARESHLGHNMDGLQLWPHATSLVLITWWWMPEVHQRCLLAFSDRSSSSSTDQYPTMTMSQWGLASSW